MAWRDRERIAARAVGDRQGESVGVVDDNSVDGASNRAGGWVMEISTGEVLNQISFAVSIGLFGIYIERLSTPASPADVRLFR